MTSAAVMSISDVVCQRLQHNSPAPFKVDWRRTARFGLIGGTLHGPFFFLGFQALDQRFGAAKTFQQALTKTVAGQLTLFPTYTATFFVYMAVLEGSGWQGGVDKLKEKFVTTFYNGSVFWPCANILNFLFVPTTQRILYINACGLLWNSYLSYVNSQGKATLAVAGAT